MENQNKRIDKIIVTLIALIPTAMFIGSAISEFFVLLTILFWFIRIAITKQNPFPSISKNPLFYPIILWLVSIYIALFLNIKSATPNEIGHDIVFLRFILLFFIILDVSKNNNIFKPFISGLIFCFIFIIFNIIIVKSIGHDIFNIPESKYFYKLSKAGDITMLFSYISPIFMGLALFIKNITVLKRWSFALFGIIAFGVIVYLKIRTAMIATIIGITAIIIVYFIFKKISIKVAFVSIFIPIIFIIVFLNSNHSDKTLTSCADRIAIWKGSIKIWEERPLVGAGVFNYSKTYEKLLNKNAFKNSAHFMGYFYNQSPNYFPNHAHNVFIQQLSCTGILGLVALIWILINLFKIIIKSKENKNYLFFISVPIVFCVQGLAGWHIYQSLYGTYFFLTISIFAAIYQNPEKQYYP